MNLSENFAVTLGREYGSGGKAIAEAVGSKLGIRVYDKSMIRMIAEQENRQPTLLDIMNERAYNQLFDPFINYDIDTNIPAKPYSSAAVQMKFFGITRTSSACLYLHLKQTV